MKYAAPQIMMGIKSQFAAAERKCPGILTSLSKSWNQFLLLLWMVELTLELM